MEFLTEKGEVYRNQAIHFTSSSAEIVVSLVKWERLFPYHARRQSFMNESRGRDSEDASRKDQLLNFQIGIATVADDSNSNTIGGISSSTRTLDPSLDRRTDDAAGRAAEAALGWAAGRKDGLRRRRRRHFSTCCLWARSLLRGLPPPPMPPPPAQYSLTYSRTRGVDGYLAAAPAFGGNWEGRRSGAAKGSPLRDGGRGRLRSTLLSGVQTLPPSARFSLSFSASAHGGQVRDFKEALCSAYLRWMAAVQASPSGRRTINRTA